MRWFILIYAENYYNNSEFVISFLHITMGTRISLDSLIHTKSHSNFASAAIIYVSNDILQVLRCLQINLIENCKLPYTQNAYRHPKTAERI